MKIKNSPAVRNLFFDNRFDGDAVTDYFGQTVTEIKNSPIDGGAVLVF